MRGHRKHSRCKWLQKAPPETAHVPPPTSLAAAPPPCRRPCARPSRAAWRRARSFTCRRCTGRCCSGCRPATPPAPRSCRRWRSAGGELSTGGGRTTLLMGTPQRPLQRRRRAKAPAPAAEAKALPAVKWRTCRRRRGVWVDAVRQLWQAQGAGRSAQAAHLHQVPDRQILQGEGCQMAHRPAHRQACEAMRAQAEGSEAPGAAAQAAEKSQP